MIQSQIKSDNPSSTNPRKVQRKIESSTSDNIYTVVVISSAAQSSRCRVKGLKHSSGLLPWDVDFDEGVLRIGCSKSSFPVSG